MTHVGPGNHVLDGEGCRSHDRKGHFMGGHVSVRSNTPTAGRQVPSARGGQMHAPPRGVTVDSDATCCQMLLCTLVCSFGA